MSWRRLGATAIPVFLLLAGAISACSDEISTPISPVFEAPPWTADERLAYALVDRGGNIYGNCEVTTEPEFEPGRARLSFLCGDSDGNRDDRVAIVDSKTLTPFSAQRTILKDDGKRTTFTSEYHDATVSLRADVEGKQNEAERDLPTPTAGSGPAWYDDESLLWLVRGIPLREGFTGAYRDINAGTGRVFTVEVSIEGQEDVQVAAGSFKTWKVRIRTASVTHYFWVDAEAPHRIIRARVEHLAYELTGVQ